MTLRHTTRPRRDCIVDSVVQAIEQCDERHFVTLTSRQAYSAYSLSKAVSEWIHRMNRALFGMPYSRHGVRMTTYVVQEAHAVGGLHAHLIIGLPSDWRTVKAHPPTLTFEELAVRIWCSLDRGRRPAGQDVRPVFNVPGAVGYVHKTIRDLGQMDQVDVLNLHIS